MKTQVVEAATTKAKTGSKHEGEEGPGAKQLDFLYKFEPGVAHSSFGIMVAEKAGLNAKVLELAQKKANQFNDRLSHLVNRVKELKISN